MKLEVRLTYDDRVNAVGTKPIEYHRKSIGISAGVENAIATRIYSNPGNWNQIVIYFKEEGFDIIAEAHFKEEQQLVTRSKKSFTPLGEDLVQAGLRDKLRMIFKEKNISTLLKSEHFIKMIFDFENSDLTFISGELKRIHPSFPKGLSISPKVEF